MNNFYVTLPSNASMDIFPSNTLTKYTVKLATPIRLHGEYDVGLVEIQFPVNWNYRQNGLFRVVNVKTNVNYDLNIEFVAYKSISDVIDKINAYYQKINIALILSITKEKRLRIKVPSGYNIELLNGLNEEFGFEVNGIGSDLDLVGTRKINENVRSLRNLYVYSDIVEHQYVGDVRSPLLRVIAVTNFDEAYVDKIYDSPHYIPVSRSNIETIEIDIRTDTGDPVHFTSDRVLVKLHFKKRSFF